MKLGTVYSADKKELIYSFIVIGMLFLSFHDGFISALGLYTLASVAVYGAICAVLPFVIKSKIYTLDCLWLMLIFYIVIRNQEFRNGVYLSFMAIMFSLLTIILLNQSDYWIDTARKALIFFSAEHIIFGFLFLALPSVYTRLIISHYPADARANLRNYLASRIFMGLTEHYTSSGTYCSIAVIIAFSYFLLNPKSKKNLFFLLITLTALVLTQKRAPLAFIVMTFSAVYFIYKKVDVKTVIKFLALIIVAGIVVIILYNKVELINNAFSRFVESADEKDVTNGRLPLYSQAIDIIKKYPILGMGWGGYRYRFAYGLTTQNNPILNAHDIYLQIFAETGIIGLIAFLSFFIYFLSVTIKIIKSGSMKMMSMNEKWCIVFSVCMQIWFLLSGVFENVLYSPQTTVPYALSVAMALKMSRKFSGIRKSVTLKYSDFESIIKFIKGMFQKA